MNAELVGRGVHEREHADLLGGARVHFRGAMSSSAKRRRVVLRRDLSRGTSCAAAATEIEARPSASRSMAGSDLRARVSS
jgi:hypothetical protein